jgi:hypothetical protein
MSNDPKTDLIYALLALDSYNHGVDPRISGLESSPIGDATVLEIDLPSGSEYLSNDIQWR